MNSNSKEIIKLELYNNFQECIIKNIEILNYGLTINFILNYIWKDSEIRSDLHIDNDILIEFHTVMELRFNSGLTSAMIDNIQNINWGINEISCIRVINNNVDLEKYSKFNKKFIHIEIVWENERKIDIVCEKIKIDNKW